MATSGRHWSLRRSAQGVARLEMLRHCCLCVRAEDSSGHECTSLVLSLLGERQCSARNGAARTKPRNLVTGEDLHGEIIL